MSFNLKLYNVHFWQTKTLLINRVDKKRDWQGSFTHEETRSGRGRDTHAFLSNTHTHTHTHKCTCNWIQSQFFLLLSVTQQRTHAETTVKRNSRQQTTFGVHAFVWRRSASQRYCIMNGGSCALAPEGQTDSYDGRTLWMTSPVTALPRVLQCRHLHIKRLCLPYIQHFPRSTPPHTHTYTPFILYPISQILPTTTLNHRLSPSSSSLQLLFIHTRPLVFPEHQFQLKLWVN
jgi:hypothetical protein